MTPRYCRHCGRPLKPGAAFCGGCGQAVAPVASVRSDESPAEAAAPAKVTAPRGGRRLLLLGLCLVLAALAVGAGAAYLLVRDGDDADADDTATGERSGALDVRPVGIDNGISVLDRPAGDWTLPVEDVLPGGLMAPLHYTDSGSSAPELIGFDDVVVGHATAYDETTELPTSVVFGVDAATGDVRWQYDDLRPTCRAVHDESLLVCARSDDDPGIALVDPADGSRLAEEDIDTGYVEYLEDDGVLYVMARDATDNGVAVHAYRLPGLEPTWSTELDTSVIECCHGDFVMDTDGPRLITSWINGEWVLDRLTGRLLSSSPDADWRLLGGYDVDESDATTRLRDGSGREVLAAPGSLWWDPTGVDIVDGRVGVGSSLYDLESGLPVWTSSEFGAESSATWLTRHEQALVQHWAGDAPSTTVIDVADGSAVTDLPGALYPSSVATTDDALVAAGWDNRLTVRDLADGAEAWSEDLSAVSTIDDEYDQATLAVAVSGVAVHAAGEHGLVGFGDFPAADDTGDAPDSGDDDSYITACGTPPEFVAVGSEAANGGITIRYELRATCPGGQWLNLSQLRVPFVVVEEGGSADDGYVYADGYFDFSDDPLWVPDEGETIELVYPYAQTQVPADDVADAIAEDGGSGETVLVPCEPGPDSSEGAVPSSPEYGADPAQPHHADGAPENDGTADDRDETALEALRRIAAEDRPAVEALEWTAQLSSKKPGTYDDGMVYDSYDDILALHLELRAQYPDSLLVFSSEWRGTYGPRSKDYWVTLSGGSDPTTAPVLRWCREQGRGTGDCWAVRLRTSGAPAGNVDHAPADARNN